MLQIYYPQYGHDTQSYGLQYIDPESLEIKVVIKYVDWTDEDRVWLEGIGVVKNEFMHKGFGTQMLKEFFELCYQKLESMGLEKMVIELDAYKENTSAINFYKKLGFIAREHRCSKTHFIMSKTIEIEL